MTRLMKTALIIAYALCVVGIVSAATSVTVTPGAWDLYAGTSKKSTHASESACVAAAKALGIARTYTCRTRTGVAVAVTADPVPVPEPTPVPIPTPTPIPDPVPPAGTSAALFTFDGISGQKISGAGIYPFATVNDSARAFSGNGSARLNVSRGSEGYGEWGIEYTWPKTIARGGDAWVRFRIYFPDGFNFTAGPWLKFLRFHTMTSGGSNVGYDDIYISGGNSSAVGNFVFISEPEDKAVGGPATRIQRGRWHTFEYFVHFDTGTAGRALLWEDGELVFEAKGRTTMKSATDRSDKFLMFTTWNGNAPATQSAWVDDLTFYTSVTGAPQGKDAAGNVCVCQP